MRSLAVVFWILFVDCYENCIMLLITIDESQRPSTNRIDWYFFSLMCTVNIDTLWRSFLYPANMCLLLLIEDKNENHYLLPEGHRRWMVWSFWYFRCTILYFIEGFKHPANTRLLFLGEEKIKISTFCPYLCRFDISEIDQFQVNRNISVTIMMIWLTLTKFFL